MTTYPLMPIHVQIWHLACGNAICVLLNRDGTWRVPPFMLFRDPIHNQRGNV